MMVSSGLILFIGGAVCCISCIALIPVICRREKKKREALLQKIEKEDS